MEVIETVEQHNAWLRARGVEPYAPSAQSRSWIMPTLEAIAKEREREAIRRFGSLEAAKAASQERFAALRKHEPALPKVARRERSVIGESRHKRMADLTPEEQEKRRAANRASSLAHKQRRVGS